VALRSANGERREAKVKVKNASGGPEAFLTLTFAVGLWSFAFHRSLFAFDPHTALLTDGNLRFDAHETRLRTPVRSGAVDHDLTTT
jgi:hypothetical protein